MQVSFVTPPQITQRILTATASYPITALSSSAIFSSRPSVHDPDVLVLSPECSKAPAVQARLIRYLVTHPNVGVVVAGDLDRNMAKLVATVAGERVLEVALTDTDTPASLWAALRTAYLKSVPARVLLALRAFTGPMDANLEGAIEEALRGRLTAMPELAASAACSLRQVYRHLGRLGITAPKDLIRVGRLIRVLPDIYRRGLNFHHVAEKYGYSNYYDFQMLVKRATGKTPRQLRYRSDPTELPGRLTELLLEASSPSNRTARSHARKLVGQ